MRLAGLNLASGVLRPLWRPKPPLHRSQMLLVQRGRRSVSTKWTVAALTGLIANARVAPALFVAHVYLSFIGQPKVVAANASPLTALALAGLETCYVPVDNIRSIPICRSRVMRLALRPCRRWRAALVQIRPPARKHLRRQYRQCVMIVPKTKHG